MAGVHGDQQPGHPYYSVSRQGYVPAEELQVGEYLLNDEGQAVPVQGVSAPRAGLVDLYNLEVEHSHNYYVGPDRGKAVLVHNGATGQGPYITNTPDEAGKARKLLSPDKLDVYAQKYAEAVNANKEVSWKALAPELSKRQIKHVRQYAREQGYVKPAPVNEAGHADFTGHFYDHNGKVLDNVRLPENLWGVPKQRQGRHLNDELFGTSEAPEGWVWHHHQEAGRMQLVRRGIHSVTDHTGGEARGGWSTYGN